MKDHNYKTHLFLAVDHRCRVVCSLSRMGCCKSQEIQKDTKDTLLQKDQQENSSSIDSNVNRGLSLQKSYSPFAGFLGLANEKNGNDGEIQPYQPPIIPQKQKIFQGKSIFKPPCFDDLRRSGWIDKRGHLVAELISKMTIKLSLLIGEKLEKSIHRVGS
jgi:hypothetical protein